MTDAWKCDRCKQYFEGKDEINVLVSIKETEQDLCPKCDKDLLKQFGVGIKRKKRKVHWSKEQREAQAERMRKRQAEGKMGRKKKKVPFSKVISDIVNDDDQEKVDRWKQELEDDPDIGVDAE